MPDNTGSRQFNETTAGDTDAVRILPDDTGEQELLAPASFYPPMAQSEQVMVGSGAGELAPLPYDPTQLQAGSAEAKGRGGPSACLVISLTIAVILLSCMLLAFAT